MPKSSKHTKAAPRRKIPNLGSLFFGVLIGIFASCLTVFMFATSDITLRIPTVGAPKSRAPAPKTPEHAMQETRYEFYTELTKNNDAAPDLKSAAKTIQGYIVQAGAY